uniref:Adiponectin receptor 1 n=1 Tax=Sinocyclocheilus grahami TaxID=75366 RepID=A0A672S3N3_SINGR
MTTCHHGDCGSNSDAERCTSDEDTELAEIGPLLTNTAEAEKSRGASAFPDEDEDEGGLWVATLPMQAHRAMEEFVHKVWKGRWRDIPYHLLPDWLKDNDYLLHGHRPPMPSFRTCFGSIFRIHTETGNIWTHLLGLILFLSLGTLTMLRPNVSFMAPVQEKVVFGVFFLGAVLCLCFSWLFHTVYCHSEKPRLIYLSVVYVLGNILPFFLGLGLSGLIPTMHFTIAEGFVKATTVGQMGWFYLMGAMYISGAALYAARIPERYFPGKCDIWFQSHQIFHVLVVAAAFVHFYGISNLQEFRYGLEGGCTDDTLL